MATTTVAQIPAEGKHIARNAESRDFDMYFDGMYIGSRQTRTSAEIALDQHVFDLHQDGMMATATELDGGADELTIIHYLPNAAIDEPFTAYRCGSAEFFVCDEDREFVLVLNNHQTIESLSDLRDLLRLADTPRVREAIGLDLSDVSRELATALRFTAELVRPN
jgi:hypothetical protein